MNKANQPEQSTPDVQHDDARMEEVVRGRTDELARLASHLQRSHEEQNRRIARELHDELGSLLTAAKLDLTFIKSKCAKAAPELVAKCERISSMIDRAAALKRRMIDQLRPSTLDMLGLGPALRELVDGFATDTGIATTVDVDDDKAPQGEPSLVVYRIIEAALGNIRDNGQAANIRVSVERNANAIMLRVSDDGVGSAAQGDGRPLGVELAGIRQRIAAAGGHVSFVATPGRGSIIEATLPIAAATD